MRASTCAARGVGSATCAASRPPGVYHTRRTRSAALGRPSCCCMKRAAAALASRRRAATRTAAASRDACGSGCTRLEELLKPGGATTKPMTARSRSWGSAAGGLGVRPGGLSSRRGGLGRCHSACWLSGLRAAAAASGPREGLEDGLGSRLGVVGGRHDRAARGLLSGWPRLPSLMLPATCLAACRLTEGARWGRRSLVAGNIAWRFALRCLLRCVCAVMLALISLVGPARCEAQQPYHPRDGPEAQACERC